MRAQGIADVIVIGAGMAGLSAAVRLKSADVDVLVVDKARGVGGRMASRRIGDASFDHGAQFITAEDRQFAAALASWEQAGVARSCFQSETNVLTETPCWYGTPVMTAIAKHLAAGIETRLEQRVCKLQREGTHWKVATIESARMAAKGVLLTPPVPQSLMLLEASSIRLRAALQTELEAIDYRRCISVKEKEKRGSNLDL
ncbi:MAG: NAD(P)-binding protein [Gammaproteobacteria bacterium]|nr:NAD(P)-binding protein [Gammaproteobacteria bacterium]